MPLPPESFASPQVNGLLENTLALNAAEDPGTLVQYIIKNVASVLKCEGASLLLYDADGDCLRFAAATGSDPEALARIPVPLDTSLAGTIFREERPLLINDMASEQRHFGKVDERTKLTTRNLAGVTMHLGGRPTGVLEAINKRGGPFTQHDINLLTVLAAQAAVALRNVRQRAALHDANVALRELDAFKSRIVSLASHELRTPLTGMLGFAEVLREEASEGMQPFVAEILEAGAHMRGVLDGMSQLMNALQAGPLPQTGHRLRLGPLVKEAIARMQRDFAHHRFISEVTTARAVVGDEDQLHVALGHVLRNAAQFSAEGSVIAVVLQAEAEQAVILVRDEGIGFTEAEHAHLFEAFWQAEDVLTRERGGLGIGLAVAREILRMHRGTLTAESTGRGRGATFRLTLPYAGPLLTLDAPAPGTPEPT